MKTLTLLKNFILENKQEANQTRAHTHKKKIISAKDFYSVCIEAMEQLEETLIVS